MCGRYTLTLSPGELAEAFALDEVPDLSPRYNIAPSQPVAAVRLEGPGRKRRLVLLRWGLVPGWAKDPGVGVRMINARSESAYAKPSFRAAFRSRRCLIPADGFYEWQKVGGRKRAFHVRRRDRGPMAFAGLWERWEDPASPGSVIESCTILTTGANASVSHLHERMPVILDPADYGPWLAPGPQEVEILREMLGPFSGPLIAVPVAETVKNPRNEGPDCLVPRAGGD
ncbi:MAG: hypothetical protein C0617_16005 [Desulfuromonas sp.]|nr:MAG: hypothetical protein C0617_16005 [Desulfuromonas sp.]